MTKHHISLYYEALIVCVGARQGLYGTSLEDVNYEKYGYPTLETYLHTRPDTVTIVQCQGEAFFLPTSPLEEPFTPEHVRKMNLSPELWVCRSVFLHL